VEAPSGTQWWYKAKAVKLATVEMTKEDLDKFGITDLRARSRSMETLQKTAV
jgi:hypothetical protein